MRVAAAPFGMMFLIAAMTGCGAAAPASETTAEGVESQAEEAPSPPPAPLPSNGVIDRGLLLAVLEGGLGRFLQGVETEPAAREGRFVGFRLVSFYPDDERFRDLEVRAGDIVTEVNGQPIERPEQALRVWDGLRVASELVIEYERDGEARTARFPIEENE